MMRDLRIAIWAGIMALIFLALMLTSCASKGAFPEGKVTPPPYGYTLHCIQFPDSIFCREDK